MKRKISILGSTGSIGRQALEVVDSLPDFFEIYALSAGRNIELFIEQIKKFKPKVVSVQDESSARKIQERIEDVDVLWGDEGLVEIAQNTSNNIVLIAVAGLAGLSPTLAAINNKIDVALANKETLVAAGNVVMEMAKRNNVRILPVDSEHSAIYQCIDSKPLNQVRKLIITGSGGPFRSKSYKDMEIATVKETLAHPRWSMGDKITVDSATLMNKGLEVIEARWLFDTEYKDIDVVIHPQSIVHSAVEFVDGSYIAQLGIPSMHIPIQYALTYPERMEGIETNSLNLIEAGKLEFEKPDLSKFPCLKLAYEAGIKGGTYPAVLNAINEEAVYAFLNEKVKLTDIAEIVEKGLEIHSGIDNPGLNEVIDSDTWARDFAKQLLNN